MTLARLNYWSILAITNSQNLWAIKGRSPPVDIDLIVSQVEFSMYVRDMFQRGVLIVRSMDAW